MNRSRIGKIVIKKGQLNQLRCNEINLKGGWEFKLNYSKLMAPTELTEYPNCCFSMISLLWS